VTKRATSRMISSHILFTTRRRFARTVWPPNLRNDLSRERSRHFIAKGVPKLQNLQRFYNRPWSLTCQVH